MNELSYVDRKSPPDNTLDAINDIYDVLRWISRLINLTPDDYPMKKLDEISMSLSGIDRSLERIADTLDDVLR